MPVVAAVTWMIPVSAVQLTLSVTRAVSRMSPPTVTFTSTGFDPATLQLAANPPMARVCVPRDTGDPGRSDRGERLDRTAGEGDLVAVRIGVQAGRQAVTWTTPVSAVQTTAKLVFAVSNGLTVISWTTGDWRVQFEASPARVMAC